MEIDHKGAFLVIGFWFLVFSEETRNTKTVPRSQAREIIIFYIMFRIGLPVANPAGCRPGGDSRKGRGRVRVGLSVVPPKTKN
jgi:hypothetical protein